MKPKGLMDLSCAYVYPVDDSLFDRSFCFQIVEKALPCLATVTYLCAGCQDSMQVQVPASSHGGGGRPGNGQEGGMRDTYRVQKESLSWLEEHREGAGRCGIKMV